MRKPLDSPAGFAYSVINSPGTPNKENIMYGIQFADGHIEWDYTRMEAYAIYPTGSRVVYKS